MFLELERLNNGGAGIFVTINETNGRGRKGIDIVRVRALHTDLDGAPLGPVLAYVYPSWASRAKLSRPEKQPPGVKRPLSAPKVRAGASLKIGRASCRERVCLYV